MSSFVPPNPTLYQRIVEQNAQVQRYRSATSLSRTSQSMEKSDFNIAPSHPFQSLQSPLNLLYCKVQADEATADSDLDVLTKEVLGERVPSTHGVGIWSYSGHTDPKVEELKQEAWKTHGSREAWLTSARVRTTHYNRWGVTRPPLRWVLVENGSSIPQDALQTGEESSGEELYSARVWYNGGVHLGKAGHHLGDGGARVSYNGAEYAVDTFEVLVGDPAFAQWIPIPKGSRPSLDVKRRTFQPIEGGRESHGAYLLIAQAACEGSRQPGKADITHAHCCIGYAGGERYVEGYRVLALDVME